MKTYKYILLDWDGNIAKTIHVWVDGCRAALSKRGIQMSTIEIASKLGSLEKYFHNDLGINDPEEAITDAVEYVKRRLPQVELYPDALEVLETLHGNGKQLALVTSAHSDQINDILKKNDLDKLFDTVVAHEDVEHLKPHAEPLEKALQALNGTKEEAVMIGDSGNDLGAGLNAGIDSVLFYPPEHAEFHDLEKLKELKPTYIVSDFRQILDIVK